MSDLLPFLQPWSGRVLTLVIVASGLGLVLFGLWRRRLSPGSGPGSSPEAKRRIPRCSRCGYELTGLGSSAPCPECGRVTAHADRYRRRRLWSVAAVGLVLVVGMPSYVVHRRVSVYGWRYYLYLDPLYSLFPYTTQYGPGAVSAEDDVRVVFQTDRRELSTRQPSDRVLVEVRGRRIGVIGRRYRFCRPPRRIMHAGGYVRNGQDIDGNGYPDIFVNFWDGGNSAYSLKNAHYEIVDGTIVLRSETYPGFDELRLELVPSGPGRTRIEMLRWEPPKNP